MGPAADKLGLVWDMGWVAGCGTVSEVTELKGEAFAVCVRWWASLGFLCLATVDCVF
jgi:hypothetical protein